MSDLANLIERVEKATDGDRRLDAEIACRFVFPHLRPSEPDDFGGEYGYQPGNIKCEHGFLMADSFTSSIDATLALVERVMPGGAWMVRAYPTASVTGAAYVSPADGPVSPAEGATPSLALLLALLRARQAEAAPESKP